MLAEIPNATGCPFTVREAAVLADTSPEEIETMAKAYVLPTLTTLDHRKPYFGVADAVFFGLLAHPPCEIRDDDRRSLYAAIGGRSEHAGAWKMEGEGVVRTVPMETRISLGRLREAVRRRVLLLQRTQQRVVSRPGILGGDPVFDGTRVLVHHVGSLMKRGISRTELREDFPSLSEEDFEIAVIFCKLNPWHERPATVRRLRYPSDEVPDRREPVAGRSAVFC